MKLNLAAANKWACHCGLGLRDERRSGITKKGRSGEVGRPQLGVGESIECVSACPNSRSLIWVNFERRDEISQVAPLRAEFRATRLIDPAQLVE